MARTTKWTVLAVFLLAVCSGRWLLAGDWIRLDRSRPHMGTDVTITVFVKDRAKGDAALTAAFKTIEDLSFRLSDYEPESELSQLGGRSPTPSAPDGGCRGW